MVDNKQFLQNSASDVLILYYTSNSDMMEQKSIAKNLREALLNEKLKVKISNAAKEETRESTCKELQNTKAIILYLCGDYKGKCDEIDGLSDHLEICHILVENEEVAETAQLAKTMPLIEIFPMREQQKVIADTVRQVNKERINEIKGLLTKGSRDEAIEIADSFVKFNIKNNKTEQISSNDANIIAIVANVCVEKGQYKKAEQYIKALKLAKRSTTLCDDVEEKCQRYKAAYKAEQKKRNKKAKPTPEQKRRTRKTLIMVASILIVLVVGLPVGHFVGGKYIINKQNRLVYNLNASGTGYSVNVDKHFSQSDIVIQSTYKGKPVVEIEDGAFSGDLNLKTVKLPTTLETIGENAFNGCANLKVVDFDYSDSAQRLAGNVSLKAIEKNAFDGCEKLDSLFELPEGLLRIESEAFKGTRILTIAIPETVVSVGANCFENCQALSTIIVLDRLSVAFSENWNGGISLEHVFTVTYDYQNATANNAVGVERVKHGEEYSLQVPQRKGYSFEGWSVISKGVSTLITDAQGDSLNAFDFSNKLTAYATWKANINRISFDANGGTGYMADIDAETDSQITLGSCQFERKGYSFAGWMLKEGNDEILFWKEILMPAEEETRVFASWNLDEYEIIYDLQGGTLAEENPPLYTFEDEDFTLFNPVKENCDFVGWIGTGVSTATTELTISKNSIGNRTYTAIWHNWYYSISWDFAGGSSSGSYPKTYRCGKELDLFNFACPTKSGKVFAGWYVDRNSRSEFISKIKSTDEGDLRIYAKWADESCLSLGACASVSISCYDSSGNAAYKPNAFSITVPSILRDMRAIGKLSVEITGTFYANVQSQGNATGSVSAYLIIGANEYKVAATSAKGGGYPFWYGFGTAPYKGKWGNSGDKTINKKIKLNADSLNIGYRYYMSSDKQNSDVVTTIQYGCKGITGKFIIE